MKIAGGVILIYLAIAIALGVGWAKNIIKLTELDFNEPYKAEVIRIVGIPVAPMGAIVGYISIGEEDE